ncbi:DUF1491 family protein [Altericroceibacterium spongiae]|uniref:DUF1491 family protein n=1 Tax=Altericroceibacterium spongiae TaxID=2320269 RepID=A0A420EEC8_9SPHN|nr:DUF1491 family protein [Altericroceibacterium spongiae]RKF19041.1 DUF1491 family protein [Altericroceibacterium spongiae]
MDSRLPTHIEISGLIRAVEEAGGFGTVLHKGERDAGTMLVICCEKGTNACLYDRMPTLEGGREWTMIKSQDTEKPLEFMEYWQKRVHQDPDVWVVELDIANAARFLSNQT